MSSVSTPLALLLAAGGAFVIYESYKSERLPGWLGGVQLPPATAGLMITSGMSEHQSLDTAQLHFAAAQAHADRGDNATAQKHADYGHQLEAAAHVEAARSRRTNPRIAPYAPPRPDSVGAAMADANRHVRNLLSAAPEAQPRAGGPSLQTASVPWAPGITTHRIGG